MSAKITSPARLAAQKVTLQQLTEAAEKANVIAGGGVLERTAEETLLRISGRSLTLRVRGLSRADSLTLDPHKGMFLPYGTGALLVRDGAALRAAHEATADYLPAMPHPADFYDPSQHGQDQALGQ